MKKHEPEMMAEKGFVPIDRVREMASRGFSEPEIIDVLRREGFSAGEIDRALMQALRVGVTGEHQQQPQQMPQQPRQVEEQQTQRPALPTMEDLGQDQHGPQMPQIPETSLPENYSQSYSTEDYIDYIVQQRMSEVVEKVSDMDNKFQTIQTKIEAIADAIKSSGSRGSMDMQVSQKMEELSKSVSEVDNRLSGLEKAFSQTLPAMVDSVRSLTDLVQKMKKQ